VNLTRVLNNEHTPTAHTTLVTVFATTISLHCAFMFYHPSINTIILGVCSAIFLSKAFLAGEAVSGDSIILHKESIELQKSKFMEFTFPRRTTFAVRLRAIAFLISTILMTVSILSLCQLGFKTMKVSWWLYEILVIGIECGRWFLITFLVYLPYIYLIKSYWNSITIPMLLQ
jgi:hypothetical protein